MTDTFANGPSSFARSLPTPVGPLKCRARVKKAAGIYGLPMYEPGHELTVTQYVYEGHVVHNLWIDELNCVWPENLLELFKKR